MDEIKHLSAANVLDLMFVFVGSATERAVIAPEPYGSLCVGMLHGVVTAVTVICYRYRVPNVSELRAKARGLIEAES